MRDVVAALAPGQSARPNILAVVLSGNLRNETIRAQIMDRLAIHDVAGLVRYAIRQGIVPL